MRNREQTVVHFAGGGGSCTGAEQALGESPDHAINHDAAALGMHRTNHPRTQHHIEDVFDVDPEEMKRTGGPIGLAWFSPDCKHFSKAKGRHDYHPHCGELEGEALKARLIELGRTKSLRWRSLNARTWGHGSFTT